ncbi:hypothetical protein NQZ79_g3511 [Umbelopsis isabellina]|nr:hypothetical protein NQZ79_g3511 [Umbelopsis isabellina]
MSSLYTLISSHHIIFLKESTALMPFFKRNTVSPKHIKPSTGSATKANKASNDSSSKKTSPKTNPLNYPMLHLQMSTM